MPDINVALTARQLLPFVEHLFFGSDWPFIDGLGAGLQLPLEEKKGVTSP